MKKLILTVLLLSVSFACTACNQDNISKSSSENNIVSTDSSVTKEKNTTKKASKPKNTDVINDQKFANSKGLYPTEKYIYSVSTFGVKRYDKITYSCSEVTDNMASIVGVTKDGVYYIETSQTSPELYLIKDDSQAPEYLYSLSNASKFFIDGDYIYSVSNNGSVIKSKNDPNKYSDSSEVICAGRNIVRDIKLYQGYIYYKVSDTNELIRVSLKNGTSESLGNIEEGGSLHTNTYYFCNDKIVFVNSFGKLFYMNLDGSDLTQYKDINVMRFFVMKDTIYMMYYDYKDTIDIIAFSVNISSIDSCEETPITKNSGMFGNCYDLSDVGIGMGYRDNAKIILLDYSGNKIGEMF